MPTDASDGTAGDPADRPWNDPPDASGGHDGRDGNHDGRGDRPIGELGGPDLLADDEVAAAIGRRIRLLTVVHPVLSR